MLRGILTGSAWGLVVGGGVLAILSLAYPATVMPPPETGAEVAPEAAASASDTDAAPDALPKPLAAPERHDASQITRPDGDTLAAITPEDLDPGEAPTLVAPDAGLGQGPDAAATAGLEPAPETVVLPSPQAMVPAAPEPEAGPEVATKPKLPPRAEPGEEVTGFPTNDLNDMAAAPEVASPADATESAAPEAASEPVPEVVIVEDATPTDEPEDATDASEEVAEAEPADEPSPADAEVAEQEPVVVTETEQQPIVVIETDTEEAEVPAPATEAEAPVATPPAASDAEVAETPAQEDETPPAAVVTLPQVGSAGAPDTDDPATRETEAPATAMPGQPGVRLTETAEAAEPTETPQPDVSTVDPSAPPIDRYAQPFENPENKPILSIVLLDSAADGATEDIPARFPYPISVAVPVDVPDAAERMRRYREAGYEVLALASLPEGATPADLETAAQAWAEALPEAVAIMERPPHQLQAGREVGEQMASILSDTGRGLLLYPEGLNTARKLASRRGVPAASVFRDLDGEDQAGTVVRRFLDHSAFKATAEGSVILVARPRTETFEALLLWGLADRASRVALAPVSHALKAAAP